MWHPLIFISIATFATLLAHKNWDWLTNGKNKEKIINLGVAFVTVGAISVYGYSLINNVEENTKLLDKLEQKFDAQSAETKAIERNINSKIDAQSAEIKSMERSITSRMDTILMMMMSSQKHNFEVKKGENVEK